MMFGLQDGIPENVTVAWGARAIIDKNDLRFPPTFNVSLVHDRQSPLGDPAKVEKLCKKLNKGPLKKALAKAVKMLTTYELTWNENYTVTLYETTKLIIIGNPKKSYGYLYLAAWEK